MTQPLKQGQDIVHQDVQHLTRILRHAEAGFGTSREMVLATASKDMMFLARALRRIREDQKRPDKDRRDIETSLEAALKCLHAVMLDRGTQTVRMNLRLRVEEVIVLLVTRRRSPQLVRRAS